LAHYLASIVAPLYDDIHATFTHPELAAMHHPQTKLEEAREGGQLKFAVEARGSRLSTSTM